MKNNYPTPSESEEQINLFTWAQYRIGAHPELDLMYHIPNGGKRDQSTAKRLKAEGVKAGVPDVCLPIARGGFHSLYIEMKAGRNKATESQSKWIKELNANGNLAVVCYGWVDASNVITKYLNGGIIRDENN